MRNHPYGFEIYLVNVKTMRTIAQIFVAFSEKLNFKYIVMTEVVWACHAQMAWKQTSYISSVVAQTVYLQSSYNRGLFSPISNMEFLSRAI